MSHERYLSRLSPVRVFFWRLAYLLAGLVYGLLVVALAVFSVWAFQAFHA